MVVWGDLIGNCSFIDLPQIAGLEMVFLGRILWGVCLVTLILM